MNLKQEALQKLINAGIEPNEASIEVDLLLEKVFGFTKKDILLARELNFDSSKFNSLLEKRINEKIPVQYLISSAYFMGEEFYVDENVLIPRPETEILVEEVIRHSERSEESKKIIDIGTGSGCIAIMLAKKLPNAEITAADISEKALNVAKFNAEKLGVSHRINFIVSDIFQNIDEKFDIIVSNPPYIPLKEKENLQIEVQKHEPPLALFVNDEQGISFYEKLAHQTTQHLTKPGLLAVEIGFSQEKPIKDIFIRSGFKNIEIIKDMSGIERVVTGKF